MKTIQFIRFAVCVAAAVFATSCGSSFYNRSASKAGMVEQGGSQFMNPFAGMVNVQIGGGYCPPSGYRGGYPPRVYNPGYGGGCGLRPMSPPPIYRIPPPRRASCPPQYGGVGYGGWGGMPPQNPYPNYYRGREDYPERGTNWSRSGRGYTPTRGYPLPHPSGYMPPPFPFP